MSKKSNYLYISTYKHGIIQMYSLVPIFREKGEATRMREFIQQKLKDQKGLTLIELLAVIVILAIIAAIAVPAIGNIIQNSRVDGAKADALNVLNAAQLYVTQGNALTATTDVDDLIAADVLESSGSIPGAALVKPGPTITHTWTDLVSTGDLVMTGATIQGINAPAYKASAVRALLEAPGDVTISN